MKIECKLIREGGTIVQIGKNEYHFAPQADGAHVADVADDEHVARFLAIPEAYKIYKGEAKAAPVVAKTEPQAPAATVTDGDNIADLKAAYREKFGKSPHHTLSAEKIKAALEAE